MFESALNAVIIASSFTLIFLQYWENDKKENIDSAEEDFEKAEEDFETAKREWREWYENCDENTRNILDTLNLSDKSSNKSIRERIEKQIEGLDGQFETLKEGRPHNKTNLNNLSTGLFIFILWALISHVAVPLIITFFPFATWASSAFTVLPAFCLAIVIYFCGRILSKDDKENREYNACCERMKKECSDLKDRIRDLKDYIRELKKLQDLF